MCENGTDAKLPQESDLKGNKNFISFDPISLIMKPFSALFLAAVVLSSCHSFSGPSSGLLTDRNLYSIDTVRMAIPDGDEKAARKSLQEVNVRCEPLDERRQASAADDVEDHVERGRSRLVAGTRPVKHVRSAQ